MRASLVLKRPTFGLLHVILGATLIALELGSVYIFLLSHNATANNDCSLPSSKSPCPDACSDEGRITSGQMSKLDESYENVAGDESLKKELCHIFTYTLQGCSIVSRWNTLTIHLAVTKLPDNRFSRNAIPSLVPSHILAHLLKEIDEQRQSRGCHSTNDLYLRDAMISLDYWANRWRCIYMCLPQRRQVLIFAPTQSSVRSFKSLTVVSSCLV
jgi:hypothetical protein